MELGRAGFEFPRQLEIDVSADSEAWAEAWSGPTAGLAVGALMQDFVRPLMLFAFDERPARFIRLRQTGRHRTAPWTVAELRVFGRVSLPK